MNNLKRVLFSFLLIVSAASFAAAQKDPVSIASVTDKDTFESTEEKFSIRLHKGVAQKKITPPGAMGPGITGLTYQWLYLEAYIQVGVANFPRDLIKTDKDYDRFLAQQKEQVEASGKSKVDSVTKISMGDLKGCELRVTMTDGNKSLVRAYVLGKTLYNLTTIFPPDAEVEKMVLTAADSFKITATPPITLTPVNKQ